MSRSLIPAALALSIILLTTFGCGAPQTETTSADRPGSEGATGMEGTSEVPAAESSRELPDGFPSDFPLPPDYDIYESRFVEGDFATGANYFVRGKSSADLAELVAFYRERLPQAGFKLISQPPDPPPAANAMFYFQSDTYRDCSVQMQQEDGVTDVLINLPLREDG